MTTPFAHRLRRLFEAGNRRIDFAHPAVRVAAALFTVAALAALGAAAWFAYLDTRHVTLSVVEAREAYVRGVQAKIQDATAALRTAGLPPGAVGTLRVRILVNRQGRLVSATVTDSSGNPALDELALRAVRESAPFDRFPEKVRRYIRVVEINSTFNFK